MKELKDRILKEGRVLPGNILKVDGFLNHQLDIRLFEAMGEEFARLFKEEKTQKEEKDVSIYKVGQKVNHPRFGEGEIVFISDDGLVGDIVFEDFGKKSLMLNLAPLEIL